ncbi:MAG: cytochrome C [Deltaproteobacteria bacterium]|nr:MAG: cytochrome C [Deltaproteobacteria bacterium]
MSMKKFLGILAAAALMAGAASVALGQPAALVVADCVKCHEEQPAQIEANGSKHKTEIDCQACHEGHRPKSANNIPQCSNCHSGKPHYGIKNCTSCHNPHQPLLVKIAGQQKEVCLTCHSGPGKEMAANPSKHGTFACNFCHADKHGMIPKCVDCHKPHSATMTQADCATCHKAHKPKELLYGASTASQMCSACHDDVSKQLSASKAKHSQLACVTCHANKHKTIPNCSDCHGLPHGSMHDKFPKCGQCHNIAHDLNNWPKEDKAAKKK